MAESKRTPEDRFSKGCGPETQGRRCLSHLCLLEKRFPVNQRLAAHVSKHSGTAHLAHAPVLEAPPCTAPCGATEPLLFIDRERQIPESRRAIAQVNLLEIVPKIIKRHPKHAVVIVFGTVLGVATELLGHVLVLAPVGILVTPRARPLKAPPWVPELHHAKLVSAARHKPAAVGNFTDAEDAVGVTLNESILGRFSPAVHPTRSRPNECAVLGHGGQNVEQIVFGKRLLGLHESNASLDASKRVYIRRLGLKIAQIKTLVGALCRLRQMEHGIARQQLKRDQNIPSCEHVIPAHEFGYGFLKEDAPQLAIVWLGENRLPRVLVARNVVIDLDTLPLLVQSIVQPHHVAARDGIFFRHEQIVD
eukprot:m.15006 g.15006  ORF g.15006 m.15006 type:complete len:363 (+) comp10593_c0_seq3:195-1283(+)